MSSVTQATTSGELPSKVADRSVAEGTALVFLASAAVLVLEIAAMRLVAPYVGVTLQTSSAVIGTALTAMALGAWIGGRLADRTEPGRLLGPFLLLGGALTLLTVPLVRLAGERLRGNPDAVVVLLLALLAVFPPAAVLSAFTPIVVKLQLADLHRTGSVVGRLSGTATLGAITATFLTGFVLIAALPISGIVLGTGGVLVLAGLGLVWRHPKRRHRTLTAGTLAVLPFVPWLFLAAPNPCQVESSYHCVRVEQDQAGSTGRLLWLDTYANSYVDLADPRVLGFEYVQTMAAVIDVVQPAPRPITALYLGGGGFTLPRYEAATRPGSTATVVEIDPGVVDVSRRYLGAGEIPGMTIRTADGRTAVAAEPAGHYDVVIGDAFGGIAVPWHLTTREAAQDVRRRLRPGGIYLVNVIDHAPDAFARAEIATLRSVFAHVALAAPTGTVDGRGAGNHVLIASDAPLPVSRIADRLAVTTPHWQVADPDSTARFAGAGRRLTDEYAPVDQLLTR